MESFAKKSYPNEDIRHAHAQRLEKTLPFCRMRNEVETIKLQGGLPQAGMKTRRAKCPETKAGH